MGRPFLTASWRDLIIASFSVPPGLLSDRLLPGLSLDTWKGQACVSLVGFQFLETCVRGFRIPGHVNFPEWNLRFYVRRGVDERGVMFIREFVPRRAISIVARTVYNEPYETVAMRARVDSDAASYTVRRRGRSHDLRVELDGDPWMPASDSIEHFFKEHRWGYGADRRGRTLRYEVIHPVWSVRRVTSHTINVDWAELYGEPWAVMRDQEPLSVVYAVGSAVEVHPAGRLDQPRSALS
ncbi:MAG: DUF2071 domain-containing protein [Planctomycetota bacterium]